jgi:hypothetical protein
VHWAEFALGPDAQCAQPTPAALARTTRTTRARPAATRARPALAGPASVGAARAARMRARGARHVHAAARHWRTGDGGAVAHRRGDGDGRWATAGAVRRPAAVRATRLRTAAVGARAVGTTAVHMRRWSGRGARGEAALSGGRAARARQLSGRAARCPDNGFKPLRRHGAWRPRGSGALPRGPGAARDD